MKHCLCLISAILMSGAPDFVRAGESAVIDEMDAVSFKGLDGKAVVELAEGREGKALRFVFPKGAQSTFAIGRARGKPEWDAAEGFSFWAKGSASPQLAALQFVWGEDFGLRYDFAFPLEGAEWRKIVVPWRDLIPVLPAPGAKPIGVANGNAPSKLGALWFGRWWYWREYPALDFAIDGIRLEASIPLEAHNFKPVGAPLARVLAKLQRGEVVTILTMGDSLTDTAHWANRKTNWPALLEAQLRVAHKSDVKLVNPAIGGTQLRQNVVLIPRWTATTPEPDLVTICFGYNDWEASMRGDMFFEAQKDAVERIRRATNGKADVLIMTTVPALERWTTMTELADACRRAAHETNAGLADLEAAYYAAGGDDRARLYVDDKTHAAPAGHELIAETVFRAIERNGAAK